MDANQLADVLGVSPMYKQKENARWSSAVHLYQMMSQSNSTSNLQEVGLPVDADSGVMSTPLSPPNSGRKSSGVGMHGHGSWSHFLNPDMSGLMYPCSVPLSRASIVHTGSNSTSPPTGRQLSFTVGTQGPGGLWSNASPGDLSQNSLELEAITAIHELSYAVQAISVSEMLPRTPELIFLNVTTLEGKAFCLELTQKGWRVTSLRHDCMNGDINFIDLHTKYFESVYALMETLSLAYQEKFGETLAAKLSQLAEIRESSEDPETNRTSPQPIPIEKRRVLPLSLSSPHSFNHLAALGRKRDRSSHRRIPMDTLTIDTSPIVVQVRHPSGEGLKQEFPSPMNSSARPTFP